MLNILILISKSCVERQDFYHFPGMMNLEIENLPLFFQKENNSYKFWKPV